MPHSISRIHDGLVMSYLETSKSKIIGVERFITPIDKDGFAVPSILMIKTLPNLSDGIQFVGFIKEKEPYYAYNYEKEIEDPVIFYSLVINLINFIIKEIINST